MPLDRILPTLLVALASVGLFGLLLWVATRAISRITARLAEEGVIEDHVQWAKRLTRFARRMFSFVALLAATLVMMRGLGVRGVPEVSIDQVVEWGIGPGLRLVVIASSAYLVTRALHFLIESLQMLLLARAASQLDLLERRKRVDTIGQLLQVTSSVLVGGVALLMALSLFNVDIRPILTGAGIAGLALGFGAQHLVRDVIAGVFLILEDQVRLGDIVEINDKSGLVEAIRLRSIVLRGLDGTVHVIQNGSISQLSNMTKDFSFSLLDVGVAYKEDVDRVMGILREVGAGLRADSVFGPLVLEPMDVLGVQDFADSAVVIRVRLKTVPTEQWKVARELRRRIKIAFDEQGVEIPFPHLSVYAGERSKAFGLRVMNTPDPTDHARTETPGA